MADMNQWLRQQQQQLLQQQSTMNSGVGMPIGMGMGYPSMPSMMCMPNVQMMMPIMPNLMPTLMPMPSVMPNLPMPSGSGFPGLPMSTTTYQHRPMTPTYTYERVTVSMPPSIQSQTPGVVIHEVEEGTSVRKLQAEEESLKIEEINAQHGENDDTKEVDMDLDDMSCSSQSLKLPTDFEHGDKPSKALKKVKKPKKPKKAKKAKKDKVVKIYQQTKQNEKVPTSNNTQGDSARRMTRSSKSAAQTCCTATLKTPEETARLELEHVPAGRMRASSKFHEEHLKQEAEKVLAVIETPECVRHLTMVARGEIQRDETMMHGGGLGPFNLFKDLQTTLLDHLEKYEVGPNMKYQVLLPEAVIFSLMKIHHYSWQEAKSSFAEYSAIVEPSLPNEPPL